MDKHLLKAATVLAAVLIMTACSSEAPKTETKATEAPKEPAFPTEPVAAKTAFYEMYRPTRQWATDVEILSMASSDVPGVKVADGKAPMWTAVFVSPSLNEDRTVTYSIADHDNVPKGVNMNPAERWSGPTPKSQPFATVDFQTNSDAAFETALPKAKEAFLKTHPNKAVSFLLGKNAKFANPVWYILWGDNKLGYSVFVNATTGQLMPGK